MGDEVVVLPDGQRTTVAGIDRFEGEQQSAVVGESVVLRLTDDLGEAPDAVTQAAVDRLAAVAANEDPPAPAAVLGDYIPGGGGVDA